jgi:hypothetical protein
MPMMFVVDKRHSILLLFEPLVLYLFAFERNAKRFKTPSLDTNAISPRADMAC